MEILDRGKDKGNEKYIKLPNQKPGYCPNKQLGLCPIRGLGIKPKRVWLLPLKGKGGVPSGKCLRVVKGGELHKLLLKMGIKFSPR